VICFDVNVMLIWVGLFRLYRNSNIFVVDIKPSTLAFVKSQSNINLKVDLIQDVTLKNEIDF
jgi:hypothetical protein